MQLNIRPVLAPQLTGLVATAGIGSVALKWDDPHNVTHKSTEVWSSATNDVTTAIRIGITTDFVYVVVDANPNQPMYYWVRSVNTNNRADGPWSVSVTKAGNAVTGTAAKMLSMGASSQIFSINKTGVAAPATINLFASAQNLQGTPTWAITSGTATLTPATNGNAYQQDLTYGNMATDQVTVQVTQDGMTDQITIVKVKDGVDNITGMLTNEAANVAADATGTVTSFANSGGNFKVYQGNVDRSAAATYNVVSSTGITISINGAGAYIVTNLVGDSGSATLRATYAGVSVDKVYTIVKAKQGAQGPQGNTGSGSPGQRGTVNIQASPYSAWSDSVANTAISNAGYGSPQNRDIVTLYNTTFSQTRFYNNGSWLVMDAYINGNLLVSGTLSADKITAGTLTGVSINIGSGYFRVGTNAEGTISTVAAFLVGTRADYSNGASPAAPAIRGTGITAAYAGVEGRNTGPGPGLSGVNTSSGVALQLTSTGNAMLFSASGSGLVQSGTATNYLSHLLPIGDNSCVLGSPTARYATLYVASGVINSSDKRMKKDIAATNLGLDFINDLNPVGYRNTVSQNDITVTYKDKDDLSTEIKKVTPRPGVRQHLGFLAQEVRETLVKHGAVDSAMWCLADANDPDSAQALRYEELISPLVKAVQELSALVKAQQAQINSLRSKN